MNAQHIANHLLEDFDDEVEAACDVEIYRLDALSPAQRRYWLKLSSNNARVRHLKVQLIDPFRTPLSQLRQQYPSGTVVYRASTGGKYGKSAQIVRL